MGTSNIKNKKAKEKLSLTSKINQEVRCPLCNIKLTENMTYTQLNEHLKQCDKNQKKTKKKRKKFDLSFDNNINKNNIQKIDSINRKKRKYSSVILKEISKNNKINLRLFLEKSHVINVSENIINNETNIKKLNISFEERYNQLNEYIKLKKNPSNNEIVIEGENLCDLLNKLKSSNIYLNCVYNLGEKGNTKKLYISDIVPEYFDLMIKLKNICIINGKTIALSLNNNIDYELFGYILSALIIYPNFKLKYKLPHLIFKLLINEKLTLNDIQYENKLLYDDLIKIKNENDFSELEIYFNHEGKDLISNGSQIKVDEYNYEDYINKMIEYEINKYKKEITIIQDTVFRYIPKTYVNNFTGEELYRIINRLI